MKKRISEFISQLLIASSLLLISAPATGQTPSPTKVKKEEKKETPLYQGTAVGLEIAGLASHLLGSDILSSEIQIQSNLKNRFLPVLEIGYGKADAVNDGTNLHYKTSAPFFRIGMDYNIMYKKTHLPGYLYVGLRYGMTSFSYDVDGPAMTDPNYGGLIGVPFIPRTKEQRFVAGGAGWYQSQNLQKLLHGMERTLQNAHECQEP